MILVPFFASFTVYGSPKNLLSLPFQAPVFFVYLDTINTIGDTKRMNTKRKIQVDQ